MSKKKVAIVIDSTAYLSPELLQQYDIGVIPLHVNWGGKSLLDGVDITPDEFYARLPMSKDNPSTSQPSVGEFQEFFSKVAETADSIVGIFISEELSGTLSSARTALKTMDDYPIEIIDSRSTTLGLGLMALAAARAAEEGEEYKAVAEVVRAIVPKIRIIFVVDTLEYLHRGGRIGGAQRFIGSMLSIKPVLHIDDGRIESLSSVRTKKKAVNHMLDVFTQEMKGKHGIHVGVLNAAVSQESEIIAQQVRERVETVEILRGELSPVIGTHTGPGAVGLAYYAES